MKIEFEDGSFLEVMTDDDKQMANIIMCGIKDYNKFTMSASSLSLEQVEALIEFLSEWKNKI